MKSNRKAKNRPVSELTNYPDWHNLVDRSLDALDMTSRELAEIFGCSKTTVTRWRLGIQKPAPPMDRIVLRTLMHKLLVYAESRY